MRGYQSLLPRNKKQDERKWPRVGPEEVEVGQEEQFLPNKMIL